MIECNENQTCLILTLYVAPSIGVLVGNILWLSSYPTIRKALLKNKIGSINPIPFPFMLLNALIWIVYSVIRQDHFIYFANVFGFILSLYYSVVCIIAAMFENADNAVGHLKNTISRLVSLLAIAAIIFALSIDILLIVQIDLETRKNICGNLFMLFRNYWLNISSSILCITSFGDS